MSSERAAINKPSSAGRYVYLAVLRGKRTILLAFRWLILCSFNACTISRFSSGAPLLLDHGLHSVVIHAQFGIHPLEAAELLLKLLDTLELVGFHATVSGLPIVEGGRTYAVLSTDVSDLQAALMLLQYRNDLMFGKL